MTKRILFFPVFFIILLLFCSCKVQTQESGVANAAIEFSTTETLFSLHSEKYAQYLCGSPYNISDFGNGTADYSRPAPICISWNDVDCDSYSAVISEADNFHSRQTELGKNAKVEFYNLLLGKKYDVKICAYKDNKLCAEGSFSFATADETVRPIFIEGAVNIRDLGGYTLANGSKIKQGMLYRSGRLGYAENSKITCEVTNLGRQQIADLGIANEIDLRGGSDGKSDEMGTEYVAKSGGFGIENVTYHRIPMGYNTSKTKNGTMLELAANQKAFREIFSLLADENRYPLLYHCNIGTDRTGAVTFLVLSLLGASKEDIVKDYCLSQLAPIGKKVNMDAITGYFNYIDKYHDGSCEKYLLSIGITADQIATVKTLLTE